MKFPDRWNARLHPVFMCEPCGNCYFCQQAQDARALYVENQRLRKLLDAAAWGLQQEVDAAMGDDHPIIRNHARIANRIRKVLAG